MIQISPPASSLRPDALVAALDRLELLIANLSDGQFRQDPVGYFHCSIGGQVRHVLDHVRALVNAFAIGEIDYDARERDTVIERERPAAIAELGRLTDALRSACIPGARGCLTVVHPYASGEQPTPQRSTLARELAFVLSHTVHHMVIIGAMASIMGLTVPPHFGHAPATLEHLATR